MDTKHIIALASSVGLLVGCAAQVHEGPAPDSTERTAPSAEVAEPGVGVETGTPREPEPIAVALTAFNAGGSPVIDFELCRFGFQAPRGYTAGNLDVVTFPHIGYEVGANCTMSDDQGTATSTIATNTEILLELNAPDYPSYLLQVTTRERELELEAHLLDDEQLDGAYAKHGVERTDNSTVLIDTPADRVEVRLQPMAAESTEAPLAALYLDVDGAPVTEAVAGGRALFVNVSEGSYLAVITHPSLRCSAERAWGWATDAGPSVWVKRGHASYLTGVDCS